MKFKFKAELPPDVDELLKIIPKKEIKFIDRFPGINFIGETIVIELADSLQLEDLRNYMRQVKDGHLMVQTVQLEHD